ncbi:DNRLRE domain-containing protein [Prosthecobacter sp.]|uniref:DNRLRE domain-containing protein n=1 Tax=Prosthecobacter sp. TaxID=1965333 RepID=UPI001DAD4AA8|nr:DNRLRE domain-containing protein [Prosthecobacter sp.]MCB1278716.1 DNRLRE domain-containing protein [Prosthecobacter sp.]
MKPADQFRLLELSERYADERLGAEEISALETELRNDAEARAFFAKALHQRAELCFDDSFHSQTVAEVKPAARPAWWRHALTAAAAACITFAIVWLPGRRDGTVATLIRSQQCQWAGSSLPTVEGARLKPGMLDLIEGLAVLRFDSGAELVLEAPATVEVLDAMNCKLRRGTLVAEVPPQAKGFSIDTKDAKVIDWGTKFGLSAGEDGKYMVQVLEGLVEVNDKTGAASKKLEKGERVDSGWFRGLLNPASGTDPEPNRWQPTTVMDSGDGWQAITTAFGHGKDSYIQSTDKPTEDFGKHPFFRVKRSIESKPELNRKGYIAFDLSKFSGRQIEDAELVLTIEPSELGFASFVPDSTFAVYGVLDESEDAWEENGLSWQLAPAHDPAQAEYYQPVAGKVKRLGQFEIAQGVNRGTRKLRSKDLVDFLSADTNQIATLIICRETNETAASGLVHAFATKENDTRSAPMLRVKLR